MKTEMRRRDISSATLLPRSTTVLSVSGIVVPSNRRVKRKKREKNEREKNEIRVVAIPTNLLESIVGVPT